MNEFQIVKYEDNVVELDVNFSTEDNTVWLTLSEMCKLYKKDKSVIWRQINNIYVENNALKGATYAKFATVQTEGNRVINRLVDHYKLDIVFEVGKRIKSKIASAFYNWCQNILNELKNEHKSNFVTFHSNGLVLDACVSPEENTVYLTQNAMADLFETNQPNISYHIKSIIEEGELKNEATHKKFLLVQIEGDREVKREMSFYNLDMILSVGYRVKSKNAILFRRWASDVLKRYLVKGYAIDEKRTLVAHYMKE
ncbi:MAG: virulence RhuM family protein [Bacilli bacterium]|nr:virulence RhuM family protein [Bacilli bacterium]